MRLLQIRGASKWPSMETRDRIEFVLLSAILGSALAKQEGLRVLREYQATVASGQVPREGVLGPLLIWVGGVLLVLPGVLTDVAGLLLLVPFTRRWTMGRLRLWLEGAASRRPTWSPMPSNEPSPEAWDRLRHRSRVVVEPPKTLREPDAH